MKSEEDKECVMCFDSSVQTAINGAEAYVILNQSMFSGKVGVYGPLCRDCLNGLKKTDLIKNGKNE